MTSDLEEQDSRLKGRLISHSISNTLLHSRLAAIAELLLGMLPANLHQVPRQVQARHRQVQYVQMCQAITVDSEDIDSRIR